MLTLNHCCNNMNKIIQKENKILRQKAKEVPAEEIPSKKIKDIIKKMSDVLEENKNGIAIAAPQIGFSLRIFIIKNPLSLLDESTKNKLPPLVFINPSIKKISKKEKILDEGCLSVEGFYGKIKRAEKLTVEALNEKSEKFSYNASELIAQIIQHEIDHLNGILFIDKTLSQKNKN